MEMCKTNSLKASYLLKKERKKTAAADNAHGTAFVNSMCFSVKRCLLTLSVSCLNLTF